ncbi:XdhC family protein [Candidatus Acetothermia bacterium]|nr:XdhC family protein [Candidatus Acetothermia bacterium]MBI3644166.1 XdhC family protein [Candidatus Acetothermia bacterium]
MYEKHQIFARLDSLLQPKTPIALATVVATSGSTYRKPGARLLVTKSEKFGAVSAGCLEDEVISTAKRVIASGKSNLLHFDTREEMDIIAGTGLGCRGTIEVFIEPVVQKKSETHLYSSLLGLLQNEVSCTLAVAIESQSTDLSTGKHWLFIPEKLVGMTSDPSKWDEAIFAELEKFPEKTRTFTKSLSLGKEKIRIYAERIEPSERLVIFGAGFDAQPLAQMALQLGFQVTVVDHRAEYLRRERFPDIEKLIYAHPTEFPDKVSLDSRMFVVIMTHNYLYDLEILKNVIKSDVQYIGQIGPRSRTEELLAEIEKEIGKPSKKTLARLHAPIGLDLGAETPEEIALSILSEILAYQNGRLGGFLRERNSPIHDER